MRLGVVEGFYGRSWSEQQRAQVVDRLSPLGYDQYIFAPKSARKLRSEWRLYWDDSELASLANQASYARSKGLEWQVGLSPLGLDEFTAAEKSALQDKIEQIKLFNPAGLSLLFDDMRGDIPRLADKQLRIVDFVAERLCGLPLLICPTYYSFDPVLERVFGERPRSYWDELGHNLDASIGFFWTGDQVCASEYSKEGLERISEAMCRRPHLWDNYPVNDSRTLCHFLRIKPFSGRPPWLDDYIAAHFVNPMNQALLSLLPLATLGAIYQSDIGDIEAAQNTAWMHELGRQTSNPELLLAASKDFAELGLEGLSDSQLEQWQRQFSQFSDPLYLEVLAWLEGGYAFDEACLTE